MHIARDAARYADLVDGCRLKLPPFMREGCMKHSIGYLGRYERKCAHLRPGIREYLRDDGSVGRVAERPADVDGVFFGYMEREGKTFVAVRAQYNEIDVVRKHPVLLDPPRHTDGKGFGPSPARFDDDVARRLLADMIAANPDSAHELRQIVDRLGLR